MYNRKWYIAKEASEDETPDKLKKKLPKDTKIMKFLGDETYSAVPFSRIQPFGINQELDMRRGARDPKAYELAVSSPSEPKPTDHKTSEMNDKDNSSITNGLLKIVADSFREDINEMESVMTVMIINDEKLQFNDEY